MTRRRRVAVAGQWLRRLDMFDWVGGRTSITSAVGLLPGASWHQHQGRPTGHHVFDDRLLGTAESAVSKDLTQHLLRRRQGLQVRHRHRGGPTQALPKLIAAGWDQSPLAW